MRFEYGGGRTVARDRVERDATEESLRDRALEIRALHGPLCEGRPTIRLIPPPFLPFLDPMVSEEKKGAQPAF